MRSLAVLALLLTGCAETSAPKPTVTTLYFFATYAAPSLTVGVNGQRLGEITTQYRAGTDCSALLITTSRDGVLSFPVRLGQHYDFSFTYSNGKVDTDALTVDSNIVESVCLIESIGPP